ncbi:hypothetical protein M9Y10_011782 [Tritrichomonas musculus]|uniref:DUF3447 domain-containing protein n=1 Tax=Tritrichomonas musculus TaxID=1915356 RepID=A0ABR2IKA1_9EUKA
MMPSLWLFAIHSNNAELIYFLEENKVYPQYNSFEACFKEAIKCHHNEIANYIKENFLPNEKDDDDDYDIKIWSVKDDDEIIYYDERYIEEKIFKEERFFDLEKFKKNLLHYSFRYYNYEYFPDNFKRKYVFLSLCRYDYFDLVKLCLSTEELKSKIEEEIMVLKHYDK